MIIIAYTANFVFHAHHFKGHSDFVSTGKSWLSSIIVLVT